MLVDDGSHQDPSHASRLIVQTMTVRTDVVVGAGSGMGAACAVLLADGQRRLVLADRDYRAAKAVARQTGQGAEAVKCDMASEEDIEALTASIGSLGRLIVTAGLSPSMSSGRTILEVNLVATNRLLTAVQPTIADGTVSVVFASTAAYSVPRDPVVDRLLDDPESPTMIPQLEALGLLDHSGLAYAISKRGVVRMVERRASAWGAAGGRLVSVSPGVIDTPMGRLEKANEPSIADITGSSALRRLGRAEEVAAVAVFWRPSPPRSSPAST